MLANEYVTVPPNAMSTWVGLNPMPGAEIVALLGKVGAEPASVAQPLFDGANHDVAHTCVLPAATPVARPLCLPGTIGAAADAHCTPPCRLPGPVAHPE